MSSPPVKAVKAVKPIAATASIEELLRVARTRAGWSQRRLADAVGVTRQHISACERGDTPLRLQSVQRLLEPLGLTARVSAEPLRAPVVAVLPKDDRLPEWTRPILAAAEGTTITGALGLRVCGVPIEVSEVQLLVSEPHAERVRRQLAAAGVHPGPGGAAITVQPVVRHAFPHELLPDHTVVPLALNQAWPWAQRQAWISLHGEWA